MLGGTVERAILTIVLIVALVGVVGLFASYDFSAPADAFGSGITGNVVASTAQCGQCHGYAPVCAKINNRYVTYDNACEAICAGADIAVSQSCTSLPRA